MAEYELIDSSKWVEEDLMKLSCKQLKVIVKQNNVNPTSSKKADLVKALITVSSMGRTELTENSTAASSRVTRSRARTRHTSYFPENVSVQDFQLKSNETSLNKTDDMGKCGEDRTRYKRQRGRKSAIENYTPDNASHNTSKVFKMVSSIQINTQPLDEITNQQVNLNNSELDPQQSPKSDHNKRKKPTITKSKQTNHTVNYSKDEKNDFDSCEIEQNKANEKKESNKNDENGGKKPRVRGKRINKESCLNARVNEDKCIVESDGLDEVPTTISNSPSVKQMKKRKYGSCSEDPCEGVSRDENNEDLKENLDAKGNVKRPKKIKVIAQTPVECVGTSYKETSPKLLSVSSDFSSRACDSTPVETRRSNRGKKHSKLEEPAINRTSTTSHSEPAPEPDTMPVPVPVRGSTFVLDNDEGESVVSKNDQSNQYCPPQRSNTFTIDEEERAAPKPDNLCVTASGSTSSLENDGKSSRLSSIRFSAAPALMGASTSPPQVIPKYGKSIGKKIMQSSSMKQGIFKSKTQGSSVKKTIMKNTTTPGSSVKKTIMKNINTPGSAYRQKFGVARKLPNFKSIHEKLFNNMESLGDNKQRKLERAKALISSPAVPSCALRLPSPVCGVPSTVCGIPSPVCGVQTAQPKKSPPKSTKAMPIRVRNVVPSTPSVSRFGFKHRVRKADATSLAKKIPLILSEKKKVQDRNFIQGVRMNKRFILQMEMRKAMDN